MSEFEPAPIWANPIIESKDPATGASRSTFNPAWLKWFVDLTSVLTNSGAGGGTGGGPPAALAPGDAVYILASANPYLTLARVTTDSESVVWDYVTNPNQLRADAFATQMIGYVVADLPLATVGRIAFVTDATVTLTAGIGTVVVGGGGNRVPVWFDGFDWRIF